MTEPDKPEIAERDRSRPDRKVAAKRRHISQQVQVNKNTSGPSFVGKVKHQPVGCSYHTSCQVGSTYQSLRMLDRSKKSHDECSASNLQSAGMKNKFTKTSTSTNRVAVMGQVQSV